MKLVRLDILIAVPDNSSLDVIRDDFDFYLTDRLDAGAVVHVRPEAADSEFPDLDPLEEGDDESWWTGIDDWFDNQLSQIMTLEKE